MELPLDPETLGRLGPVDPSNTPEEIVQLPLFPCLRLKDMLRVTLLSITEPQSLTSCELPTLLTSSLRPAK
jgi:hypothetical protein